MARWIGRIRDEVYEGTRKDLVGRLKLDDSDFEALLRLAHSQIDVSLSAVLTSQRSE